MAKRKNFFKTVYLEFNKGDKKKFESALERSERQTENIRVDVHQAVAGSTVIVISDYVKNMSYAVHKIEETVGDAIVEVYDSWKF